MSRRWSRAIGGLLIALVMAVGVYAQDVTPIPDGVTIHVVQRGENLFRIAQQYATTIDRLVELNSLYDPDSVQVGQRLLVPLTGDKAGEIVTDAPTLVPTAFPTLPPPQVTLYTIQRGETLFRIAQRYGLSVGELAQANSLSDPTLIFAGQQILIPGSASGTPAALTQYAAPFSAIEITPAALVTGQAGRFTVQLSAPAALSATFLDRPLMAAAYPGDATRYALMVGVPITWAAGVYPLTLNAGGVTVTIPVSVAPGNYIREFVTIPPERADLLSAAIDDAEYEILRGVTSAFTPDHYFSGAFGLPAVGVVNSSFGNLRSYNGGLYERAHVGTDFRVPTGAPILAPAAGRVVLADTLNVRGMATVIDHGWGVYSSYSHQSQRYVSLGETVQAGQTIGAVGSSGRATGAHLHWEVWVSGIPVNPIQWTIQPFG